MGASNVALVVGVGPGLGGSVAERFAREGFAVGLVARSERSLAPAARAILEAGGTVLEQTADASDENSLGRAVGRVRAELGEPSVLVYNAGAFMRGAISEVSPADFESCWRANCFGAFLAARQVLPAMLARGSGTVLLTGATASLRGGAGFSCLAVGKFGLRALSQSMARELGPKGIHVAHVIIDGQIDTPRIREMLPDRQPHTLLDPDQIAEAYWQLHVQHPTAWTLELDLRPAVEKF